MLRKKNFDVLVTKSNNKDVMDVINNNNNHIVGGISKYVWQHHPCLALGVCEHFDVIEYC